MAFDSFIGNRKVVDRIVRKLHVGRFPNWLIFFYVNITELLLTDLSRCQVYNFTPLTLSEIRQHGITDELVVRWSQGSIGRARGLDMADLKMDREVVLDFLETALTATEEHFQDLLSVSAEIGRAKQEFEP